MLSPVLLFGLILINSVLFLALGLSGASVVRNYSTPAFRKLGLAVAAICTVLFFGSLERLAFQAVRAGWVGVGLRDFMLSYWDYGQAVLASVVGFWAFYSTKVTDRSLMRAELVSDVLTDHLPLNISVSELGLTSREMEALEVLAGGALSDREIAEALYISPVTAGTHVRNILRKADLHNRHELLVLGGLESDTGVERS